MQSGSLSGIGSECIGGVRPGRSQSAISTHLLAVQGRGEGEGDRLSAAPRNAHELSERAHLQSRHVCGGCKHEEDCNISRVDQQQWSAQGVWQGHRGRQGDQIPHPALACCCREWPSRMAATHPTPGCSSPPVRAAPRAATGSGGPAARWPAARAAPRRPAPHWWPGQTHLWVGTQGVSVFRGALKMVFKRRQQHAWLAPPSFQKPANQGMLSGQPAASQQQHISERDRAGSTHPAPAGTQRSGWR